MKWLKSRKVCKVKGAPGSKPKPKTRNKNYTFAELFPQLEVDEKNKLAYIKLKSTKVTYTKEIGECLLVDYDINNFIVGIEILNYPYGEE